MPFTSIEADNTQIRQSVSEPSKHLIPQVGGALLERVCPFSYSHGYAQSYRQDKERNDHHKGVNIKTQYQETYKCKYMRQHLNVRLIGDIPDRINSPVINLLSFPEIGGNMVIHRQVHHFSGGGE